VPFPLGSTAAWPKARLSTASRSHLLPATDGLAARGRNQIQRWRRVWGQQTGAVDSRNPAISNRPTSATTAIRKTIRSSQSAEQRGDRRHKRRHRASSGDPRERRRAFRQWQHAQDRESDRPQADLGLSRGPAHVDLYPVGAPDGKIDLSELIQLHKLVLHQAFAGIGITPPGNRLPVIPTWAAWVEAQGTSHTGLPAPDRAGPRPAQACQPDPDSAGTGTWRQDPPPSRRSG